MQRRPVTPFSLSFLDIMFCGFGAVVLLVLVLNHDTVRAREQTFADLRAEVVRLEQEVLTGTQDLVAARNSLEATDRDLVDMQGTAERVIRTRRELEQQIARLEQQTLASREHINRLKSDLPALDEEQRRLGAAAAEPREAGDKVRAFRGEGDRQYLTGLKMGGRHILILVDTSASMLDETIVNVIRRRNLDTASRRAAPKWRRALAIADWLVSNLPPAASFQLYGFNTQAQPALAGSAGKWLAAGSRAEVDGAIAGLRGRVPEGGTSLHRALAVAQALAPRPDNIILVTDGLPTQGRDTPAGTTVSPEQRLVHFNGAVRTLGGGIPVNTILLPMEGDATAAAAYWKLAIDTHGSFLAPSRDWP